MPPKTLFPVTLRTDAEWNDRPCERPESARNPPLGPNRAEARPPALLVTGAILAYNAVVLIGLTPPRECREGVLFFGFTVPGNQLRGLSGASVPEVPADTRKRVHTSMANPEGNEVREGLANVTVANSSICHVDGQQGRLIYQGYYVQDLAEHCCFEEVAHLLWHGSLPTANGLEELRDKLVAESGLTLPMLELLCHFPHHAAPMSVLRTAVSALGLYDPRAESHSAETNLGLAYTLTAKAPSIVAAYQRYRKGLDPITPDPGLSHAGNFLYGIRGQYPEDLEIRIFDNCLTLHAEHGFNASTFAARVTAATLSDMFSAITAAIGALRGPLHGGANMRVMGMLREIGTPENAREWVLSKLERKERIMGFGHRVYKVEDPRAAVLRRWCRELGDHTGQPQWADICQAVEEVVFQEKGLCPNVDFYSASVYHMLGIDNDLYTCIFAIARMVGWTAHVLEQWSNNKLIRPLSHYTGPLDLQVVPIDQR